MAKKNPTESTTIHINAAVIIPRLFIILVAAEIFFVLADHFINVNQLSEYAPVRRFFNITREDGLASWFSVTQNWMAGLTTGMITLIVSNQDCARQRRTGWFIMMAFLLYMAMDDGTSFHERVGSTVKAMFQDDEQEGLDFFPSYTWQLLFVPIFGGFGLFILWFLNSEIESITDKLMVLGAIGLLVTAVSADFFEGINTPGHVLNLYGQIAEHWQVSYDSILHYSKSIEEFLEMLSMSLFWFVFLRHLVHIAPNLEIHFCE
jgi:hypothetical protein